IISFMLREFCSAVQKFAKCRIIRELITPLQAMWALALLPLTAHSVSPLVARYRFPRASGRVRPHGLPPPQGVLRKTIDCHGHPGVRSIGLRWRRDEQARTPVSDRAVIALVGFVRAVPDEAATHWAPRIEPACGR